MINSPVHSPVEVTDLAGEKLLIPPGRQVSSSERLPRTKRRAVVYGQPPSEVDSARELLGLSDTEARLLPNLPRGQALWKVGTRSFLVDHRLSPAEASVVDTDARMGAHVSVAEPAVRSGSQR